MAVSVLVAACSSRTVFSEFRNSPLSGWDKDSVLVYEVGITDTVATYDVVLSLRHGQNYPYQNIWFFVEDASGVCDTLEYYLADQRGRWLGNNRFGERMEMPCLVGSAVQFAHPGTYVYKVRHGMREAELQGVTEVGLTVEEALRWERTN